MRLRHLDAVAALERQVYPRPWTTALFSNELQRTDDRTYLVARRDGRVVGYGGVLVGAGEAHVLTVAVDPSVRRAGVATRLVAELLAVALERGATDATLEVRESNHAAEALYRRFGFESAGVRPGYYEDNGEGARIMWLHELRAPAARARIAGEAERVGHPVPDALRAG
jgi:ribosomal-protein-alanine N-acetyltransferase